MSEFSLEKREAYVKDLDLFIKESESALTNIVSELGWTLESINEKSEELIPCPFYSSHRVPVKSLEHHLEACQWKAEGYNEYDKPFSEIHSKKNDPSSIEIDEELQTQILQEAKTKDPTLNIGVKERLVPRTSNRLFSDFTRDERKALYEYAILHTVKPDIGQDIADFNKAKNDTNGSGVSLTELLAQERDLKRRRVRHRGIHTNKKSLTEIMREVINQQMEMFSEYLNEKEGQSLEKDKNANDQGVYIKNREYGSKTFKISSVEYDNYKRGERHRGLDYKNEYKKHKPRSRSRSRHRVRSSSRSRSRHRVRSSSRTRERSRSKHKKKDRHRSKERHDRKKKKRSRSREKKSRHKDRREKRRSSS